MNIKSKLETFIVEVTIYPSDYEDLSDIQGYKSNPKVMQDYLDNEMRLTMEGLRAEAIDIRRDSFSKPQGQRLVD